METQQNLAIASFLNYAVEVRKLKQDQSVGSALKRQEYARAADFTLLQGIVASIDLMKREYDAELIEGLQKDAPIQPDRLRDDVIAKQISENDITDNVKEMTKNQAGNLEIAVHTQGRAFNVAQLLEKFEFEEAKQIYEKSLDSVLRKQKAGAVKKTDNALEAFESEYLVMPPTIVEEIFQEVLSNHFTVNYNEVNGQVVPKSYVGKDQPLQIKQEGVPHRRARSWVIGAALLGLGIGSAIATWYNWGKSEDVELRKQLNASQSAYTELEGKYNHLLLTSKELAEQNSKLNKLSTDLQALVEQQQGTMKAMNADYKKALGQLASSMGLLDKERAGRKLDRDKYNKDIDDITSKLAESELSKKEAEGKLLAANNRITSLEEKLRQAVEEGARVASNAETAKETYGKNEGEYKKKIQAQQEKIGSLEAQLAAARSAYKGLESDMANAEKEYSKRIAEALRERLANPRQAGDELRTYEVAGSVKCEGYGGGMSMVGGKDNETRDTLSDFAEQAERENKKIKKIMVLSYNDAIELPNGGHYETFKELYTSFCHAGVWTLVKYNTQKGIGMLDPTTTIEAKVMPFDKSPNRDNLVDHDPNIYVMVQFEEK